MSELRGKSTRHELRGYLVTYDDYYAFAVLNPEPGKGLSDTHAQDVPEWLQQFPDDCAVTIVVHEPPTPVG